MRTTLVAKRKAKAESIGPARRPVALTIKGNLEWRGWVDRGAVFCRTDTSKLVDAALVEYLRSRGFAEEPPPR
ncbi:hypothetical protein [Paludisphaera rhizosphaerae]|uniref:hypothetical protein n=1 Tax=Paludisphaera rhizosphaerae TaxID=2711216 RepID=UPI0013EB385E|nr:hypothetical protein [Paludisphaera rhizosphaerae]